jgi:RES domain-containing protein
MDFLSSERQINSCHHGVSVWAAVLPCVEDERSTGTAMIAFRIANRRFTALDGEGAAKNGGRWNSAGRRVVYAAETYAGAVLELLVHMSREPIPKTQMSVKIVIPGDLVVETATAHDLPDWDAEDRVISQRFGDRWLDEARSVALRVPGAVLQGREFNLVVNPMHPDFSRIEAEAPEPVVWDPRLFRRLG